MNAAAVTPQRRSSAASRHSSAAPGTGSPIAARRSSLSQAVAAGESPAAFLRTSVVDSTEKVIQKSRERSLKQRQIKNQMLSKLPDRGDRHAMSGAIVALQGNPFN